ncbi:hypothetical protein HGM15179_020081 [Zosterops borbonicus]|uniref:Peptidase A2 domain-containing protein n=1 Tax=Zosterops borbonicus TaxID=364589 RepID=A0A8K1FX70_9PASS|nr:hypothetical protein HGM15179_020081 [Zosterops borbonicus]
MIFQGTDEPFLRFAEGLTASVEQQVDDFTARGVLLTTVAKSNYNAECRKVNEALPGKPSFLQMVEACSKMGTTSGKVVALATIRQPIWKGQQGEKQKQANAQAGKKKGKKGKKGSIALFYCGHCGRLNHMANACKATVQVNGQPLSSSGNGRRNVKGKRAQTSVFPIPKADGDLLGKLTASTCRSAGVDVCTAETVVLKDSTVHKIPLDAFGPLGDGLSSFLMGRSSTTIQGIIVHLGLVDADYTGRIYAIVSMSTLPLTIPEKTRIAQLVPFKSSVPRAESQVRGDGSFGSTGPPQVFWTDVLTKKGRPEKICTLSLPGATPLEIHLHRTLDTGADVTIVSIAAWPLDWPLDPVRPSVAGLGGTKQCYVSQKSVTITNPEGQAAVVQPHVTDTPASLRGRDALATWGVCMGTDF